MVSRAEQAKRDRVQRERDADHGNGAGPDETILDLDELIEPLITFRIEGNAYAFVRWDVLSVLDQKAIERVRDRVSKFQEAKSATENEAEAYRKNICKLITMISDMPIEDAESPDAFAKVRHAVHHFFTQRATRDTRLTVKAMQAAGLSTSENSSRDSSAFGLSEIPGDG